MKHVVRASMALVALAAFALSFQSLMRLGELAGYGQLAPLFPIVVDLGTVACCAAWLSRKSREAFHATWVLLAVSVGGNGLVHWLLAAGRVPSWPVITLVGTVPPLVLGLCVHLAVGLEASGVVPADNDSGPEDLVERVTARITRARQSGEPVPGRRKLAAEFRTTEHQVRAALAATNGHAPVGGEQR